jgi:hypothetical protein
MLQRTLVGGIALLIAVPGQAASDPLAAVLEAKTQALLDAIAPGEKGLWNAALAPNLVYVTENNEVLTKDELIKQIEPLPPGISGNVKVTNFRLQRDGKTAITTYIADETENYHAQILHTKYRTTDTWQQLGSGWRMIASMTFAVLEDPPSIALPEGVLRQYVGRYELTPDIHYNVRTEGGRLLGQREGGGKEVELKAESPDLFFVPGAPRSRKVFYRDSGGKVVGFGDRREGHDVKWKRLS